MLDQDWLRDFVMSQILFLGHTSSKKKNDRRNWLFLLTFWSESATESWQETRLRQGGKDMQSNWQQPA